MSAVVRPIKYGCLTRVCVLLHDLSAWICGVLFSRGVAPHVSMISLGEQPTVVFEETSMKTTPKEMTPCVLEKL